MLGSEDQKLQSCREVQLQCRGTFDPNHDRGDDDHDDDHDDGHDDPAAVLRYFYLDDHHDDRGD